MFSQMPFPLGANRPEWSGTEVRERAHYVEPVCVFRTGRARLNCVFKWLQLPGVGRMRSGFIGQTGPAAAAAACSRSGAASWCSRGLEQTRPLSGTERKWE